MNKETGIIMMELAVYDLSFEIIKNGFAIFSGLGAIKIYDKSSRKQNNILLPDEFKNCLLRFLSGHSVIGINMDRNKIITTKLII